MYGTKEGGVLRIAQRSIEQVREAANIVEVASEFTALRRQGTRYSGLCPYPDHSEKTPSFSVTLDRGFYYCFGCQRGGDAIKLVSELKSFSFADSVSYLAERSGIELEFEGNSPSESKAAGERAARRRATHKSLAAAAVYYHKYLLNSQSAEAARRYLEGRGINGSTIEEFRLGYAPERGSSGLSRALEGLGLDRRSMDAAGLLSSRGGERFSGRITFPISDRRGRIVGFGARAMGDAQPKYLNSPEMEVFNKRDLLYGFPQVAEAIRKERSALVVEGYTDVLMLYQSGIKNAVATLGTATTPAHLRTLSGFADRIYILFDPDAAGEKAIERAAATAAELKMDLRVVRLPEDPADWLLGHPPEEFARLLSGAVPILEYSIRRIARRTRGADAMKRSRAVPEVKALIREVKDPVLHREALRLASEALGVSVEFLQEPEPRVATEVQSGRKRTSRDPLWQAGREVLALVLARPDLNSRFLEGGISFPNLHEPLKLRAEDFGDEDQSRLFTILQESGGNSDRIFADERTRSFMDQLGALAAEGEKLYPSETAVREAWLRLKILSRKRDKNDTSDYDEKERIHAEIQLLTGALRTISAES
ncbi:MAG: DNA primase [Rubrobacteraceae bacterium]